MRLHSLDGLRVLAEFSIVQYNLFGPHGYLLPPVIEDLTSFFFVLSGFCVTFSHTADYRDPQPSAMEVFRHRLLVRVMPVFICSLLLGLIADAQCMESIMFPVGFILHFVMLSPWSGLPVAVNEPSWYIVSLAWLWAGFAISPDVWPYKRRPLACLLVLYILSCIVFIIITPVGYESIRGVPVLRCFEFAIGCCTAHSIRRGDRISHWAISLTVVGALFGILTAYYVIEWQFDDTHFEQDDPSNCTTPPWPITDRTYVKDLSVRRIYGRASLMWAALIFVLAHDDMHCTSMPLITDFLRNPSVHFVNRFSLEVYLYHKPVAALLRVVTTPYIDKMWTESVFLITVYCFACLMHMHFHPRIRRAAETVLEWMYPSRPIAVVV